MTLEAAFLFLGILSRLLIVFKAKTDFDTYGHLYFAYEVKKQKTGPFGEIITQVVGSDGFRHPFLWHWIIGRCSFQFFYKYKRWINAVLDSFFVVIVYYLLTLTFDSKIAFYTSLLYFFTPILFTGVSIGPRIKSLTPRITSEIMVNFYFIFLMLPVPLPEYIKLSLAVIAGIYTLLSSKFGIQAIIFISVLLSLILWSVFPLIMIALLILLCIIITKGDFLSTLKHQAYHLIWYFRRNLKSETPISNRNNFLKNSKMWSDVSGIRKVGLVFLYFIKTNSYSVVLLKLPALIMGLILLLYNHFFVGNEALIQMEIYGVMFAGFSIYILVNIPVLLFLGEAERYLNHIVVFVLLVTVILSIQLNAEWLLWAIAAYGFVFWLAEMFVYNIFVKKLTNYREKEKEELLIMNLLQSIIKQKVIVAFPYHAIGVWRIMLETIHKTVYPITTSQPFLIKLENQYSLNYPFLNLDKVNDMVNEFGVDILIVNNKEMNRIYGHGWNPPENWSVSLSGKAYTLYSRNSSEV